MNNQDIKSYLQKAIALTDCPTFDGDLDYKDPPIAPNAEAAVLILINTINNPSIILTQRQSHMRKHAGQVAFPGGRKDEGDVDHWETALRETREEIGMPESHAIDRIGQLNAHKTITRFWVTPCVAMTDANFPFIAQEGEVANIFEVPLARLHPDNFRIEAHDYNGMKRHYYVLPHDDYFIWGATARMLQNLGQRLKNVGYF